jgi:hypothetical protein
MRELLPGAAVLAGLAGHRRTASGARVVATDPAVPPAYVLQRLAAWRLLHDLPFGYLVPDAALLPPESIRFFHLDAGWLAALTDAALGLGADPDTWAAREVAVGPSTRAQVISSMRWVREVRRGRIVIGDGGSDLPWPPDDWHPPTPIEAPPVTGFLLRSALVSGWRGTQVRAWTTAGVPSGADAGTYALAHPDEVVALLRLQRLSPGVLLALFAGVPRLVWLEEPHHGVQLGVDAVPGLPGGDLDVPDLDLPGVDLPTADRPEVGHTGGRVASQRYTVEVRDEQGRPTGVTVAVPMRTGPLTGMLDAAGLAASLDAARPLDTPRGGGAMALALLQPPARQRFAGSGP